MATRTILQERGNSSNSGMWVKVHCFFYGIVGIHSKQQSQSIK
jgi:hypothetical protein